MKIVNLTPHAVTLRGESGETIIPPSGFIARAVSATSVTETIEVSGIKIPLTKVSYGELTITNVAGEKLQLQDDTIYIVSSLAAQAASDEQRKQLVTPSDLVRDEQGRVIAARALALA